ncbi:MAG: VanZ family protein [Candidatus Obscuribacterales bacterium]|nr:VanZ family protein [Candidatus Obscuribacterales bacterium]
MKASTLAGLLSCVLVMGAIFALSAQAQSFEFTRQIFGSYNTLARKSAHFSEFACLFLALRFTARALSTRFNTASLTICCFLFCVLAAAADEWHQSFVPGRSPALRDVLIDSIGAASAALVWTVCSFKRKRVSS